MTVLMKLEQLERLLSDDTPRCPMITHTIDSYGIQSQKDNQRCKFKENAKIANFAILHKI